MSILDLTGVLIHTTAERHQEMRDFYIDALELSPRSDRPGFTNFEFGSRRLTITVHDEIRGATREPVRIMLNFETDDIVADFERLIDHGAPSIRQPSKESWGGLVATSADPDGNVIQLMEFPR